MPGNYRFSVGTKVLCRTGAEEWSAGKITQLNYTEPGLPRTMPYQVKLEDGRLIFVPADVEELCRKLVPVWWENIFAGRRENYFINNPPANEIRKKLEKGDKNVNELDHKGEVALMRCAQFNWPNGVSELLQMKADVNIVTAKKKHALHFALPHGECISKILIDAQADVNCQEDDPDFDPEYTSKTFGDRKEHRSPLHIAALLGDVATAALLLNGRAKVNIRDAQQKTPLHLAIEEENAEMIDFLAGHNADVNLGNTQSGMNNSPLMVAAHCQNIQLVKKLLAAKASVNQKGKQEMAALHLAARKGDAEIVQVLLDSRADVNQTSQCGTVANLARKNGGVGLLKVLGLDEAVGSCHNVKDLDAAQRAALYMD